MFVYSGLFKYIANDDELASVMGHEIGHAIARHGAERLSRGVLGSNGRTGTSSCHGGERKTHKIQLWVMQAFGIWNPTWGYCCHTPRNTRSMEG